MRRVKKDVKINKTVHCLMKTCYYKISKMSDLFRRVGVLEADRKKLSSMWLVIQSYLLHNIFSY